ncbi:MAG: DNA/RNA non-specific endonuclease [Bacteroidales bacterium]
MRNYLIIIRIITALSISGTLFNGCTKDETETMLTASLTSNSINATVTSQFLKIMSNGDWQISVAYVAGEQNWCSSDVTSGNGDRNVILMLSVNTSAINRVAEIKISSGEKIVTLTLTQLSPVNNGGGNSGNLKWLEIPSGGVNTNSEVVTHTITLSNKTVRNYSMLFDKQEKIAYWVAYPHHNSYIGSTGRTDNWQWDPKFSYSNQANFFSGINGYDRGHQIPSADRTCSFEANSQTFYFTNMTPQQSSLNQFIWAKLEGQVRTWMEGSDTLYVVTGAILKTTGKNETVNYATDATGGKIAVPNYYYKVLLRLKGSKYDAIGFWLEHRSYGNVSASAAETKSIDDIEALTGFDFFSNLANDVENTIEAEWNPKAWNL